MKRQINQLTYPLLMLLLVLAFIPTGCWAQSCSGGCGCDHEARPEYACACVRSTCHCGCVDICTPIYYGCGDQNAPNPPGPPPPPPDPIPPRCPPCKCIIVGTSSIECGKCAQHPCEGPNCNGSSPCECQGSMCASVFCTPFCNRVPPSDPLRKPCTGRKICAADGCKGQGECGDCACPTCECGPSANCLACQCGPYYCKRYPIPSDGQPYPCACWDCGFDWCACVSVRECHSPTCTWNCDCTDFNSCPCPSPGLCGDRDCTVQ